jgi:hypothetical protein
VKVNSTPDIAVEQFATSGRDDLPDEEESAQGSAAHSFG